MLTLAANATKQRCVTPMPGTLSRDIDSGCDDPVPISQWKPVPVMADSIRVCSCED